jgi:hypothetical protein
MSKESEQSVEVMTYRDQRVSVLTKIKDFYFNEWAREGFPQDSQRALRASLEIISTLENEDPILDKECNFSRDGEIHAAIIEKSAAGRTLIIQL